MNQTKYKELKDLINQHGTNDGSFFKKLPNVIVAKNNSPTEPTLHLAEPMLSVILQGDKLLSIDKKLYSYGPCEFLITTVDLPVNSQITKASKSTPFLGIGMVLNPTVIAELLLSANTLPQKGIKHSAGIRIGKLADNMIDPMVRLLNLLDSPEDIPVLAPSIEREILWRLINGPQGATIRQLGLADSSTSQVSCAIKWIKSNFKETLRVEKLAKIAGMSVTSFHRHFRLVTSLSPLQYQKLIRLQEARMHILSGNNDITSIGMAVDYDSSSQFSREYRRMFGVPPKHDREIAEH